MTTDTNDENATPQKKSRRGVRADAAPATETSLAETGENPAEPEPTLKEALEVLRDPSGDGTTKVSHGWTDGEMQPLDRNGAAGTPEPGSVPPTADAEKPMSWTEAAAAADAADAERKANEWEWDTSEEVLDIKLTDADMADLLRANGADEEAKAAVDRAIDTMKAELKEKKAESEAIAARMKDRNRSGAKGVHSKKATWKVGTCFALNTARYIDPLTDRVVFERALHASERQVALPLAEPARDGQLSLGDAATSEVTDPEALLDAAEAAPSSGPIESDDDDDLADEDDEDADS